MLGLRDHPAVGVEQRGFGFDALPEGAVPIYGFEAKWLWDRPENPLEIFECPARISETLRFEIELLAINPR